MVPESTVWAVPSKEAIEYGRRVAGGLRDKLRRWEQEAADDPEKARRFRFAAFMVEHDLLGSDEGGCVITAFDRRWLDDTFRKAMTEVRDQIAGKEADHGR